MRIIGHRGARGEAPENTLAGFHYLKDLGIRAVEFDVRQLSDQQLVVIHDDHFQRTAQQALKLTGLAYQDIQHINQAALWSDHAQQATPLLSDVLPILADFEHIEVEIKSVESSAAAEQLIEQLSPMLDAFTQQVVVTSFDPKILIALQLQRSTLRRGLLVEMDIATQAIDFALQLGCCQIGWQDQLVNSSILNAMQQAQLNCSVWTVNDVERAKLLADHGVQGLITDYPKRMQQYLSTT
ncbi:glycerophosphodiester phosphodiesterase [Acinetobacter larvae]|uniref:Glycerophosphodiester phosphodiesterase n=1 Tax=Acinetobacter larvae TaxID=1789224 RepID=A0A1B2LX24_9GAMM|nr:glycerophosphodiester phosphodiesterase [Acinetobacter larvae]AOA57486.1 glycerophosphodiester phosphodiesterase [Acinetobacter larvae]